MSDLDQLSGVEIVLSQAQVHSDALSWMSAQVGKNETTFQRILQTSCSNKDYIRRSQKWLLI